MTKPSVRLRRKNWIQVSIAIVAVLAMFSAIPFVTMPTMGQAVWSLGFSQSFANQSIFAIHAINFGQPHPAAISFGLSGAYPAGLLIRLGLAPQNAYTTMFAAWLVVAFFGARAIGLRYQLTVTASNLCAVMWLGMPMVWMHIDYSMLSLGFALLPWYFHAALRLVDDVALPGNRRRAIMFVLVSIVAVFMDGYTFVMFAVSAAMCLLLVWISKPNSRRAIALFSAPVMAGGLGCAYVLYAAYQGHPQFASDPIEVFRAWGVDISYIILPTWGIQWLPDLLHFEHRRMEATNYGDASVWNTTFSLPLILLASFAWIRLRKRTVFASIFLAMAFAGGYMALGPSLKVFSHRNPEIAAESNAASMPRSAAIISTGSGRLSMDVPGLKNMRASYRWLALGLLGCWLLVVLAFSVPTSRRNKILLYAVALLIVSLNFPHTLKRLKDGHFYEVLFRDMDVSLQQDLSRAIPANTKVAFLPWNNDFFVNYLAARAKLRAFNIGGDKNVAEAIAHWPAGMSGYSQGIIDPQFTERLSLQLSSHEIDAAVIPYFDTLWSAHYWPCPSLMEERASSYVRSETRDLDASCPAILRQKFAPTVAILAKMRGIHVEEHEYFALIRLANGRNLSPNSHTMSVAYPINFGVENPASQALLRAGWFNLEDGHIWSGAQATLDIPLTASCRRDTCVLTLTFNALAASPNRRVELHLMDENSGGELACVAATGPSTWQIQATVRGEESHLLLSVPAAASPAKLGLGADQRVLGIALMQADVHPGKAFPSDSACAQSTQP